MVAIQQLNLKPKRQTSLNQQPKWLRDSILLGNKFHYRKKRPIVHNTINISVLILILLEALGVSELSTVLPALLFIPLASIAFGLIHFMLFILVVHEASHNMFIVHKNQQLSIFWNRCFGWIISTFYGIEYIKHWEVGHQVHHIDAVESHDPQNCPNTIYVGKELFKYTLIVLLLPGYFQFVRKYDNCQAAKDYGLNINLIIGQIMMWATFIYVSTVYISWEVSVATFFGIQVLSVLNQFKIAMEHGGEIGCRENPLMRSCSSFFSLRNIIMPLNISLHFEHHLNYCVPWYDLLNYHKELRIIVPGQVQKDVFKSNLQVWKQIQS
jgi:fatty acid desaturase